jgi:putative NIF3 family GTP cyclohydrolase 1 type 2
MSTHAQTGDVTARLVVDRIQRNVAVPWRADTVDTFKAGDPDTRVRGIATTFMATFDVIQRAAKAGRNFVISHEPTFYNHLDETKDFAADDVLKAKMDFIRGNQMIVWRFHDHWHARRPDGVRTGMLKALGWTNLAAAGAGRGGLTVPDTTLLRLAQDLQARLGIRAMRIIGDPQTRVRTIALGNGYGGPRLTPDVDAIIVGEQPETDGAFDSAEYALDVLATTKSKGMIIIGHAMSEEDGMAECAEWLKTFVTEVPIEFIRAGEPFWAPKPA